MKQLNLREKLPSEKTRIMFRLYSKLAVAVLILASGLTLALSGLVLIPMMAFAYKVMAVIGAAAMVAAGATMAGGAYIWLTNPA